MIFLGIDNGVTGSVGIIMPDNMAIYKPMPVFRQLNYTKSVQWLHRVDGKALTAFLHDIAKDCFCMIERPMINPGRWKDTVSAIRALEATQTVLEMLNIPCQFVDSKEWQSVLLPKGLEKEELKEASLQIGKRLFPQIDWSKFKDADGLLLAEFARRTHK